MGHALNNTIQDILVRYHRMNGFNTLWQPGTDHAGIATQMVVERNLEKENIFRKDLSREEFIEKIWEWREYSGSTIINQLKDLVVLVIGLENVLQWMKVFLQPLEKFLFLL